MVSLRGYENTAMRLNDGPALRRIVKVETSAAISGPPASSVFEMEKE
jgi:hypothetical protein